MDFGRVSLDAELILYLFGTPGQHRFWFMWDDLVRGAIGAVVLVDTRRLADSFAAIDFFEDRGLPYVVGLNCFDGMLSAPRRGRPGGDVDRRRHPDRQLRRPQPGVHEADADRAGRARHAPPDGRAGAPREPRSAVDDARCS